MAIIYRILFGGAVALGGLIIGWSFLQRWLNEDVPNRLKPAEGYAFDYIIVGGGTAGCVLATLLTKHTNSTVLLIEAGDTFGFIGKIPLFATFLQKSVNDWSFFSTPQEHSSRGLRDRRQALPRGKGLGGSSQINYMLHFDGYEKDFLAWTKKGLSKWSYEHIETYLDVSKPKREESFEIRRQYSKIAEAFSRAANDFEHKPWKFRNAQYTTKQGYRWGIYDKYLKTAYANRNFKILTNAMVHRVNLKNGAAESVVVSIKSDHVKETTIVIFANKEIVLSAGAYQTPQILLCSGIGPPKRLKKLGIPIQLSLPQVGQNLYDHMNLPLFVSISQKASINIDALMSFNEIFNYATTGKGHFGNFGVIGYIDALENQNGVIIFGVGSIDERVLMTVSNFQKQHFRALFPLHRNTSQEGFVMISTCYKPEARGYVSIKTDNIRKSPLINPNYLSMDRDIKCTIKAIRIGVKIIFSDAFAFLQPKIHWPKIKECSNFGPFKRDFDWNQPSNKYLECVLRHVGLTSHHPGGSCSMGLSPADGVVDQELRVHGVNRLRIVDASIIPTPLSGNPNAIIEAVAVRGAAFIIKSNEIK